jgi:hypothetical protein
MVILLSFVCVSKEVPDVAIMDTSLHAPSRFVTQGCKLPFKSRTGISLRESGTLSDFQQQVTQQHSQVGVNQPGQQVL